ncbi:MAG: MFS transporter [Fibrobacter sp.]|nr:MFS transporter [Fibrobacter sp.]
MWKTRGTIPYFISIFAATFVQMGHFVFTQKVLNSTYGTHQFLLESALLQGLFLLPFIFMIIPASYFSNKFPKEKVIAWTSAAMTVSMLLIALFYSLGFAQLGFWFTLLLASAFAVQSPAKYGILKEMFGTRYLGLSNAYLQIIMIAAMLVSSWLMIFGVSVVAHAVAEPTIKLLLSKTVALPWILLGMSVLSTVMAFCIPKIGTESPKIRMRSPRKIFSSTWSSPVVRASILGLAILWGMIQVFVLVFQDTSGSQVMSVLQNSLVFTFVGLVIGSIVAGRASRDFIETGLIPLGALGTTLCMLLIPFTSHLLASGLLFALVGFFAGLLLVVLNSLIQFYTRPTNAGRIISVSNMIQIIVLGVFLGIYVLLLRYTPVQTNHLFFGLAIISIIGFTWAIRKMPQALLRSLLRTFFSRYRLKVLGVQNIPAEGPVLLVGNHHSFIDWAILQMASPRPLRVAINKDHFERWYLRWVLKRLNMIRIHRRDISAAMNTIHEALLHGEAVVIFPEGEVSQSPHVGPFMMDFSSAVEGTDAMIIPFYIQGLWGSRYSRSRTVNMFGPSSSRIITVAFSEPVPQSMPANELRNRVRSISIDAWLNSISYYRPLASSWLRACKKLVRSGPAIYSPDGKHFSGYRLLAAALAFSRKLKKITAGEKNVAVMLPPSSAGVIGNLAVWILGKTNVNLNYTSPIDVIRLCIERADVKTVFTSRAFMERLKQKGMDFSLLCDNCKVIYAEDVSASISSPSMIFHMLVGVCLPSFLIEFFYFKKTRLSDVAVILFSSGSEGIPKGVMLTHENMIGNVQQTSCIFNFTPGDVMLAELPIFHSFGLLVTIVLNLMEGSPIVTVADPTDIKTMARVCAEFKVTVVAGTPTFLRAFTVNRWVHPLVFSHVRFIFAGAEKLRPELTDAFRLKFGKNIYEGYGCTETTPVVSANTENVLLNDYLTMQVNNKLGTVGMAIPGTCIRVVDPETGENLPVGEQGMVLIGGCQVMKGYLKDPERTSEVISEYEGKRWYRTGDKGFLDEDGFLTIVDRYSRFAKLGGEMISLGAVEIRINESKVLEGCDYIITAIPDKVKGECIVLLYVGEKDPADILRELRIAGLPPLMIPGLAFKIETLPKLGSGKTDFTTAKKVARELAGVTE